jgi:hypothetical protein
MLHTHSYIPPMDLTHIFTYMLLLPEGQTGEAWNLTKSNAVYRRALPLNVTRSSNYKETFWSHNCLLVAVTATGCSVICDTCHS